MVSVSSERCGLEVCNLWNMPIAAHVYPRWFREVATHVLRYLSQINKWLSVQDIQRTKAICYNCTMYVFDVLFIGRVGHRWRGTPKRSSHKNCVISCVIYVAQDRETIILGATSRWPHLRASHLTIYRRCFRMHILNATWIFTQYK